MTERNDFDWWDQLKQPPPTALKTIRAGRLKGKTDINPQWRYQALTETFGPCGIGWKYEIVSVWNEPGSEGQVFAFANVNLYIRPDGSTWSEPIPGIGGSTLVTKEKSGLYSSDEGYKMAITDALSVACKMIGVAADIYAGAWDGTKYRDETPSESITENQIAEINTMIFDLMKSEKIKDDNDFETRLNRLYGVKEIQKLTKDQANSLLKKLGEIK